MYAKVGLPARHWLLLVFQLLVETFAAEHALGPKTSVFDILSGDLCLWEMVVFLCVMRVGKDGIFSLHTLLAPWLEIRNKSPILVSTFYMPGTQVQLCTFYIVWCTFINMLMYLSVCKWVHLFSLLPRASFGGDTLV